MVKLHRCACRGFEWLASLLLVAASLGVASGRASADAASTAAALRVRLELSAGNTFTSDGVWLHDAYGVQALELEWMLVGPLSMGLRALPLLMYFDRDPIVGGGLGVSNRLYTGAGGTGFYLGLAASVVAHSPRFERNSSNLNFLSSLELGHQFAHSRVRVGVKFDHVSNANLARFNRGWNGVSLLFGVTL